MGQEITEAVEESRTQRKVGDVLNSTYLTLIPKKDHADTFNDYRPISLCNLRYKLVTKIIAERLKQILGKFISEEQFAFLQDRKITDGVGVVQECLHTTKVKRRTAFFLTLDLAKAYNRVDWSYLKLILIQVGLTPDMVEWMLSAVTTSRFVVLINGVPTEYFHSFRGLREGFPLSPYLFILAI